MSARTVLGALGARLGAGLGAGVVLLAGCTLGPDYERPELPLPEGWRAVEAEETRSLADLPWWELFQDPALAELIRIALEENKDLGIAVERIEEARARYGFTRADLYPKIDVEGTAGGIRTPGVGGFQSFDDSYFSLAGSLSWELDFFGRIRRASEAQQALLFATEEARRAVVISLVADVARAYLELGELDRELEIARRTLESRREYVQLASDLFEGDKTSELDWRRAQAERERTAAVVVRLEALAVQKENELSVLLGRNPGDIARGLALAAQPVPPDVPAGLPSQLLERRPDVRFAEELLVAANAGIGEAKALLYPRISLTGSYGFASTELDDLVTAPSRAWSFGANILQPIFNSGQNRRRVEVAESQQRQALLGYELAVLQAFREVEDALVALAKTGEERLAQAARVEAERRVLELAELRYRGGVDSYLSVLDAQRSLFAAELEESQAMRDQLVAFVQLYRALGGGWTPPSPEQAALEGTATDDAAADESEG